MASQLMRHPWTRTEGACSMFSNTSYLAASSRALSQAFIFININKKCSQLTAMCWVHSRPAGCVPWSDVQTCQGYHCPASAAACWLQDIGPYHLLPHGQPVQQEFHIHLERQASTDSAYLASAGCLDCSPLHTITLEHGEYPESARKICSTANSWSSPDASGKLL